MSKLAREARPVIGVAAPVCSMQWFPPEQRKPFVEVAM